MVSGYDKTPPPKVELEQEPGGPSFWFIVFVCILVAGAIGVSQLWSLVF